METENIRRRIMLSLLNFTTIYITVILGSMTGFIGSAYFPAVLTPVFKLIPSISMIQHFPIIYGSLVLLASVILVIFLVRRNISILKTMPTEITTRKKMPFRHIAIVFALTFLIGTGVQEILYLRLFLIY